MSSYVTGKLSFTNSTRAPSEHRIGKFMVSERLLRDNWEDLVLLFAGGVIVDMELRFDTQMVTYWMYHPAFEANPPEVSAPLYEALVSTDASGNPQVTWQRKQI